MLIKPGTHRFNPSPIYRALSNARYIVQKYAGSIWTPSPSSCFQDVAGTTPCAVDTTVGLMLDDMRTLGAELALPIIAANYSASGCSVASGSITFTAAANASYAAVNPSPAILAASTYEVTLTIDAISVGSITVGLGNNTQTSAFSSAGEFTARIRGTADGSFISVRTVGASTTAVVSSFSVKEVTGIHATQATAGYRPTLWGKVKNYLLNSATLSTQNVTTFAVPYTLQFKGTGTVTLSGTSTAGPLVGTGASDLVTLTFTPTAGTLTLTVSGSVTVAQLELGTVANPYVPTTTAAASSSYGPYAGEYDGTDDRMSLTAVPFQMSDDFFVVVGATNLANAAVGTIFSIGSTLSINPLISINFGITTGYPYLFMRDDAGANITIVGAGIPLGTPCVLAVTQIAGVRKLYVNGVQVGTNSTALGAATFNAAGFGATLRATPAFFLNGKLHGLEYGKGAITDAELLTIERYIGAEVWGDDMTMFLAVFASAFFVMAGFHAYFGDCLDSLGIGAVFGIAVATATFVTMLLLEKNKD